MFKVIDYIVKLFNYSTLNKWEGSYMCSQLRINKHPLSNLIFFSCVIIALQMQHKLVYLDLVGRSWRPWKWTE